MILNRDGLRKYPCTLPLDLSRRAFRHLWRAVAPTWAVSSALYIAAFLAVTKLSGGWTSPNSGTQLLTVTLWVAILVAYLTIGTAPLRIAYRRAHTSFFTQARHCLWCLYDLSGVPPDSRTLTTCPECGGVWRLPSDPTTTFPASAAPHPPPTHAG